MGHDNPGCFAVRLVVPISVVGTLSRHNISNLNFETANIVSDPPGPYHPLPCLCHYHNSR